ncbi:MAG: MarR family winged helix-turn-helix transcriptional regulator [Rhodoglobus sp.]
MDNPIVSARDAANDPRILVFGRLLGAANRLDYILGRALEEEVGIPHSLFELLLVIGRAGENGTSLRDIAQARVLTSGGATRLVKRASEQGLIRQQTSVEDARKQIVHLTPTGEALLVRASTFHVHNIERYLIDVLPADQAKVFAEAIKSLSQNAARSLPTMP